MTLSPLLSPIITACTPEDGGENYKQTPETADCFRNAEQGIAKHLMVAGVHGMKLDAARW